MDEAQTLEALSDVLTALSENVYDISLHAQHINLAQAAGIEEQAQTAREMMTTYWAAGDEVWMPLIDAKLKAVDVDSISDAEQVRKLFDKAEGDYLCA
ncbi:hypothetical protein OF83DRAFT_1073257 [Amylostereum chailletii]|nr:hypothetical protein OF83DRAFT_1073257 [Amylostereum chailletii]